ncbi:hypothetical protein COR50_20140 [Chitinophaga caeni]|uniref:Uncharacterized protein n=1 Tax=Chitinophaga caeni TaxID=2029983 RepID=A0A291QZC5_9BACT|nr:hypothetical protein [Chitinophaga caeni]ATL49298.1 hypothetical protein COR50_20140 [Chitinophaga caeni]
MNRCPQRLYTLFLALVFVIGITSCQLIEVKPAKVTSIQLPQSYGKEDSVFKPIDKVFPGSTNEVRDQIQEQNLKVQEKVKRKGLVTPLDALGNTPVVEVGKDIQK